MADIVERVKAAIAGEIDCVDWTAPDGTMGHAERLDAIARYAARAAIEAMPLADAIRWIETLAEPDRFGPVTDEKRKAALAFAKAILKEEGNG